MDSSASPSSSPSSSPSPSPSLVSKARTVLHSAATKAEKVLTDIRSDLKSDRDRGDGQSQKSGGRSAEEQQAVSVVSEVPAKAMEEFPQESKHSKWKHMGLGKKQDWQHSLKNVRMGKKDVDEKFDNIPSDALVVADGLQQKERDSLVAKEMSASGKRRDILTPQKTNIVPPASVLKNLAAAIEKGRTFASVKNILTADNNLPLMKEKTGLSFSVVKSLVLREKDEKLNTEICGSAEISSAVRCLFDSEFSTGRKNGSRSKTLPVTYIRGAPPESFLVKVSEITGNFKSLHKMVLFWHDIVAEVRMTLLQTKRFQVKAICFELFSFMPSKLICHSQITTSVTIEKAVSVHRLMSLLHHPICVELRRRWSECKPIPYMPLDENPDLDCCHLHQQMQVINCCVARKLWRTVAMESLDSLVSTSSSDSSADFFKLSVSPTTYVRSRTGDNVLRLGASRPSRNLIMLETGEPVYSPVVQEGPVLTEELIKETEEFVLRTGSIGAGCSQLLSDMQAFKAANPGCILEDFVRWYSPPDWKEENLDCEDDMPWKKGCLSGRMQREGNLWRELWETAKPLPAAKQAPLFDEDLAVESIFTSMVDMPPSELLEQQFLSLLYAGFVLAESAVSIDRNFSKLFNDCKEYAIATCQGALSSNSISELCKVYETMETILTRPEEVSWVSEERISEEPKNRLKKLGLPFVSKDRLLPKLAGKDQKKTDESNVRVFSSFFDGKTSLFAKKQTKSNLSAETQSNLDESDWTVV